MTTLSESGLSDRVPTAIVRGMAASDGAGVRLTRVVGTQALGEVDPFLMLDEFGSDDPNAYIAGFPDHPHRGFETITYMLAGRMRHRDSRGNEGLLGPGDVQWMTTARGLVHSEMPEQQEGLMRGFQLWLNLPAKEKMLDPRYQDIPAARIPETTLDGATLKVLAGTIGGVTGPIASPSTTPVILDIAVPEHGRVALPLARGLAGFAYVFEGLALLGGKSVGKKFAAVLGDGDRLVIESQTGPVRVLLVAGKPIGEPVARYGPFVMNTRAELQQAFVDYQNGLFDR